MRRSALLLLCLIIAMAAHVFLNGGMWESRAQVRSETEAGYVLPSRFSRILALGYQGLLSDYLFLKTVTFYGERQMLQKNLSDRDWDYFIASLDVLTDLDPYFFDLYILAEGNLAWEGKVEEANRLLEKGRNYRDWDWRIPYFIGFNYFYFQKDFESAGPYIMEAAKLPGSPSYLPTLAARLAYYGGKTETGIFFLQGLLAESNDPRFRAPLEMRLHALEGAAELEKLIERYKNERGQPPDRIEDLMAAGYIDWLPDEPYGGEWVILKTGRVFSTSKFVSARNK
jgi:hypothetical protein